jgi:hypothetical protein
MTWFYNFLMLIVSFRVIDLGFWLVIAFVVGAGFGARYARS